MIPCVFDAESVLAGPQFPFTNYLRPTPMSQALRSQEQAGSCSKWSQCCDHVGCFPVYAVPPIRTRKRRKSSRRGCDTSLSSSQWGWYNPYVSCLLGNCGQHARICATYRRRCQHNRQRPDCRVFRTHGRGTEASEYQPRSTLPLVVDSSCRRANSEEQSSCKASRDIQFSPRSSHGTHLRTPSRIPTAKITREYRGAPFLGDNHRRECRQFGSSRALSRGYRRKLDGPVASARHRRANLEKPSHPWDNSYLRRSVECIRLPPRRHIRVPSRTDARPANPILSSPPLLPRTLACAAQNPSPIPALALGDDVHKTLRWHSTPIRDQCADRPGGEGPAEDAAGDAGEPAGRLH